MSIKIHNQFKHFIVILAILIFFWVCPPFHPALTPIGMKLLGLVFACCYGWTFVEFFWPTIIAFILVPFTGICTPSEFLQASFGHYLVLFLMFIFMLSTLLEESGLIVFISNWLVSRKFLKGKPWLLILVLMFGSAICTAVCLNVFLVLFMFWGIATKILETCGYQKGEKVPTMILTAITCGSMCGYFLLPYGGIVVVLLGAIEGLLGLEISYVDYMLYSFPMGILSILICWAILRWGFRPNVEKIKQFDPALISSDEMILSKKAKIVAIDVAVFMLLVIVSSLLPVGNPVRDICDMLGLPGMIAFTMLPLMFITVDGKKVWDLSSTFSRGVKMDILLICAFVIPVGSYISSPEAGVSAFFLQILQPLITNLSPFVVALILGCASMIATQLMANVVACYMFLPMIGGVATAMGVDPLPMAIVTVYAAHIAIILPSASGYAALTHSHDWTTSTGVMKYGMAFLITGFIMCAVSYFWAGFVF